MYGGITTVGLDSFYSEISCGNCGETGTVRLQIQGGYFHVIFFPIFSHGKSAVSRCRSCQEYLIYNQMPIDLKIEADEFKKKTKVPIWYFSGAICLIIGLPSLVIYNVYKTKNNNITQIEYFENPQVEDIYHYKMGLEEFTLLKLDSIGKDSLYFKYNKYVVFNSNDLKSLNTPNKFEDIHYGFSKKDVDDLINDQQFFKVERIGE